MNVFIVGFPIQITVGLVMLRLRSGALRPLVGGPIAPDPVPFDLLRRDLRAPLAVGGPTGVSPLTVRPGVADDYTNVETVT